MKNFAYMTTTVLFSVTWFISISTLSLADTVLEPTLGPIQNVRLDESFESSIQPDWLRLYRGSMKVDSGFLKISEIKAQKHIAAVQCDMPLKNMAIRLDFQFQGADELRIGFNPSPGELKKKGHLFVVQIERGKWSIVENNDKSIPNTKNQVLATQPLKIEADRWYQLLIENVGEQVQARIGNEFTLKCSAKDFSVKKPGFVIRASSPDNAEMHIDNLRVWDLQ